MIDHELTDPTSSALTITHNDDGVWITATVDREEVTVGPFPARTLRASFDMGDDLLDGGVTAAAIEAEVDGRATWAKIRTHLLTPERARSLVQERDGAVKELDGANIRTENAERERHDAVARAEAARELFHGANMKIVAMRERAEHAEAFAALWKETARRLRAWRDIHQIGEQEATGRAEKAEQERQSFAAIADNWQQAHLKSEKSLREANATVKSLRAEHPRPLTAREHLDAAWDAARVVPAGTAIAPGLGYITRYEGSGQILAAVEGHDAILPTRGIWGERRLLDPEPPARPEWAADIEAVIRGNDEGVLDPTMARKIADRVAEFMAEQENRAAGAES